MAVPASEMTHAERQKRYDKDRRRYLPTAIENTRRKLRGLEDEARRRGMEHLL